jgi:hypothetical protein
MSLKYFGMNVYYQDEIKRLKIVLESFYNKQFSSEEEELKENRGNKNLIKKLIILANSDEHLSDSDKQLIINDSLKLLAENTGCAEDSEIAENLLDYLFYDVKILNQKNIDEYYNYTSTGRWE